MVLGWVYQWVYYINEFTLLGISPETKVKLKPALHATVLAV